MGLPWLDQPVMLHSSRADHCTLTPEQCAYRDAHWRYWYASMLPYKWPYVNRVFINRYQSDHVYALNTIYFLCATVGVFSLLHLISKYGPQSFKRTTIWRRSTTVGRYLAYRCFQLPVLRSSTSSLGVILLVSAGAVFFLGWYFNTQALEPLTDYIPSHDTGTAALLLAQYRNGLLWR